MPDTFLRALHIVITLIPDSSAGKESTCNAGNLGSMGRSPGKGNSYLLQCSGPKNSMDYIVHGVAKDQT